MDAMSHQRHGPDFYHDIHEPQLTGVHEYASPFDGTIEEKYPEEGDFTFSEI